MGDPLGGGSGSDLPPFQDRGNGVVFDPVTGGYLQQVQRADGEWALVPVSSADIAALENRPRSSFSVSQALRDPLDLALDSQKLELEWASLQERIRQYDQQAASDRVQLDFLKDKFSVETDLGRAAEARQTAALQEQIAARAASTAYQRTMAVQSARELQAQLNFQAAQANAQAQLEAQRANVEIRARHQQRLDENATRLADFARAPSDAAAMAGWLIANNGANAGIGALSTRIAQGDDARTPEALTPGGLLLQNREELAKGPQLITAPTITAPVVPEPQFPAEPSRPQLFQPAFAAASGGGGGTNYAAQYGAGTWNPSNANTGFTGSVDAGGNLVATPTVAAADGFEGLVTEPTTFLVAEEGPEHVSVTPTGSTPPANPEDPALTAARNYLNSAGNTALARSPWAKRGIPTPVGVSAPGTSAYVQKLAASIAAALRGVSPDLYMQEAANAAPVGISPGAITRRSR